MENIAFPSSTTGKPKEPVTSRIYEDVLEDIRSGKLSPGQKLKVREMSSSYGGSVGSCREVLVRLASESFVETRGMTGFRVRELSSIDLLEALDLRDQLEGSALSDAIRNGNSDWEERLLLAFHRLDRERTRGEFSLLAREKFHREFHVVLIDTVTSTWHGNFVKILNLHCERYRRILLPDRLSEPNYLEEIDKEHETIMRLAINREEDTALEALKEHRGRTRRDLLDALNESA